MNNTTQNKNARVAAIYVRSATENPTAVREQQEACESAARRDGLAAPAELRFVDDGWSGVTTERPALQRMLDLVRSGEAQFERVYMRDRSRLGRFSDPRQHFAIEMALQSHGIEIRYLDGNPIDWDSREAEKVAGLLRSMMESSMGAAERRRLTERVRRGTRSAVLDGSYPGSFTPYGTERYLRSAATGEWLTPLEPGTGGRRPGTVTGLKWKEPGAAVIARIYALAVEGHSLRSIADRLQADEVPSRESVQAWSPQVVGRILRDPLYRGDLVWGKQLDGEPVPAHEACIEANTPILYRDFCPQAPVSREQWARAQRALRGRRN